MYAPVCANYESQVDENKRRCDKPVNIAHVKELPARRRNEPALPAEHGVVCKSSDAAAVGGDEVELKRRGHGHQNHVSLATTFQFFPPREAHLHTFGMCNDENLHRHIQDPSWSV
jgi:hypothetical protein